MSFFNPPSPPDPSQGLALGQNVAAGQNQYNLGAQAGSNYNQSNPYGTVSFGQTGTGPNGVPIYTANNNLSPTQQNLFNAQQFTKMPAGSDAATLMANADYGNSNPVQDVGNMTSGLTGQLEGTWLQSQEPFFQTQTQQEDTQLRNQGLEPGEPGYDNAMRALTTNQGLAVGQAASQFEPQAFNQATSLYNLPAATAENLSTFASPTLPSTASIAGAALQPANLIGATANETQALQNQYDAQMQQYSGMMNGIFGTAADVLGVMAAPATGGLSLAALGMGGMGGGGGTGGQWYGIGSTQDPYGVSNPYYTP